MLSGRAVALAISAILLFVPLAFAANVATDFSTIQMTSCSRGSIYAYAEDTEGSDANLSISANFGKLYGSILSPIQRLPAYQSRGSRIDVYSSQCFKGDEDVIIYFQLCRNSSTLNSCQNFQKTVRMIVGPCTGCTTWVEQHLPAVENYAPATPRCIGTGCGQPLISNVYFEESYEPSDISLGISFAKEVYYLSAGDSLETEVLFVNQATAVTIDLSLEGAVSELSAKLYETAIGLESGQKKSVGLSINPKSTVSGEQCLSIVASRRGLAIDRSYACFIVYETASAGVSAPSKESAVQCASEVAYSVKIENTGAFENTFYAQPGTDAAKVSPQKLTLSPGASASFSVVVNATKLKVTQDVDVTVTGDRVSGKDQKQFSQTVRTSIVVPFCEKTKDVVSSGTRTFSVVENFHNPSDEELLGVVATIEGLPAGFVVTQEQSPQNVAPGASANFTIIVTAPSDAQGEVAGVLVIRSSSGRVLRQRPVTLSTVSEGGITGFFTKSVGSSMSYIIALLLGAAIVALFYARNEIGEKVRGAVVAKPSAVLAGKSAAEKKAADAKSTPATAGTASAPLTADENAGDSATINS
ncbi:MAG: hypothetical protein WC408_04065 [Candidatus Micrarchaeia archaeon]|jgi:hypothetical protein